MFIWRAQVRPYCPQTPNSCVELFFYPQTETGSLRFGSQYPRQSVSQKEERSPKQKISYCLSFPVEYLTCNPCYHKEHVPVNKTSIHKEGNAYPQNNIEQISVIKFLKKAVKEKPRTDSQDNSFNRKRY